MKRMNLFWPIEYHRKDWNNSSKPYRHHSLFLNSSLSSPSSSSSLYCFETHHITRSYSILESNSSWNCFIKGSNNFRIFSLYFASIPMFIFFFLFFVFDARNFANCRKKMSAPQSNWFRLFLVLSNIYADKFAFLSFSLIEKHQFFCLRKSFN